MKKYDCIVVGLGAHGSSTLYHLAKNGLNVLGIEQFKVAHSFGSSHGLSRIIRLAYFEDPAYVAMLRRAYTLWSELEAESGRILFTRTGSLDIGNYNKQTDINSTYFITLITIKRSSKLSNLRWFEKDLRTGETRL